MSEDRIPRQVEGVDVKQSDITAQEAFVYSCIDGVLNVEDIADLTVQAPAAVSESIERLISLGLAEWVLPKASSPPPKSELVEDVDIDEGLQKQIFDTFRRVHKLNHYEILGVAIDASRSDIRKAYFALSKTFHPDSYFGKELGSFKAKMELIFRRATDAYEALGRPKKREAYDRYLQQSMTVSAAERQINRVEERARAMAKALTKVPVAELDQPVVTTEPPGKWRSTAAPSKAAPVIVPGTAERDRIRRKRELLERKLGGRSRRPLSTKPPPQPASSPAIRVDRKTALRDLTRSLKQTAALTGGVDRAEHHIEAARTAESEGDFAAAATALRMAIALDSNRAELREQYQRVNSRLRVQLVDIHRQQATYEEDNKMWAASSISWAKVAEAAPDDPIAPRRAAKALLAAGGDLRKARDFALRSLELAPDSVETRVLLARIYLGAGMDNSAAKELDEAAKLDPGHQIVKDLRQQLGG